MKLFVTAAVAALAVALPAKAVTITTYSLVGPDAAATSFNFAGGGNTLNVSAAGYNVAPSALTTLAQLSVPAEVRRFAAANGNPGGLGVFRTGDNEPQQIDTNGANEVLRLGVAGKKASLKSAQFSYVDADDTLRLYGVNGTTMTLLGYAGEFLDNTADDSAIPGVVPGAGTGNNRVFTVNFANIGRYDSYVFTSNNDSADGYRLQSVSLAVPEPESWALMLGGFALLGTATRRRRGIASVTA